jgi:hypothetical protein
MLAEIFMLLLEAAARAAKFEAAHSLAVRPDHIAGFSGLNRSSARCRASQK